MKLVHIPIEEIQRSRYQPRTEFDPEKLEALARSIERSTLLHPISVRRLPPDSACQYELVAGERRWRAMQLLSWAEVPAFVQDINEHDAASLAFLENMEREELSTMDFSQGINQLRSSFGYSLTQVAKMLGRSRTAISRLAGISEKLVPEAQEALDDGISFGHAKVLMQLPSAEQQELLRKTIEQGWSVRKLEQVVRRSKRKTPDSGENVDANELAQRITEATCFSASVSKTSDGWQIAFDVHSSEELISLFEAIARIEEQKKPQVLGLKVAFTGDTDSMAVLVPSENL